jgi:cell wall-associated NlpC family hydrolase
MSGFGPEIVSAARSRIGRPFRHHFKPFNLCKDGIITANACMEKGMDNEGYDCSGLVIASLCDVLGILPEHWPRDYRHVNQLEELAETKTPDVGDVLLFLPVSVTDKPRRTHIGIFATEHTTIHASGISDYVEEGQVEGMFREVKTIPSFDLAGLEPK